MAMREKPFFSRDTVTLNISCFTLYKTLIRQAIWVICLNWWWWCRRRSLWHHSDIIYEPRMVTLEWIASPCNDMFADAVLSAVLQVGAPLLPSCRLYNRWGGGGRHVSKCLLMLSYRWREGGRHVAKCLLMLSYRWGEGGATCRNCGQTE